MFLVEGATADTGVRLFYTFAGPGYFDTMGIDGVAPLDLMTFLVVPASMVVVGLLASYLPARRASLVDPLISLRGE